MGHAFGDDDNWYWPFQTVSLFCPENLRKLTVTVTEALVLRPLLEAKSVLPFVVLRTLLGSQILHHCSQTDHCSSTNLLGVVAFMQQTANATQQEL